jgi:hypothetical protein
MSSSKSSLHIVLVDPIGDVLFSGESLRAREGWWGMEAGATETSSEECPVTLRSPAVSKSGVYPSVRRRAPSVPDREEDASIAQEAHARRLRAA